MQHANAALRGFSKRVPPKSRLDLVIGIVAVQLQGQRVRLMAGALGNVHLVIGHLAQVGRMLGLASSRRKASSRVPRPRWAPILPQSMEYSILEPRPNPRQ